MAFPHPRPFRRRNPKPTTARPGPRATDGRPRRIPAHYLALIETPPSVDWEHDRPRTPTETARFHALWDIVEDPPCSPTLLAYVEAVCPTTITPRPRAQPIPAYVPPWPALRDDLPWTARLVAICTLDYLGHQHQTRLQPNLLLFSSKPLPGPKARALRDKLASMSLPDLRLLCL